MQCHPLLFFPQPCKLHVLPSTSRCVQFISLLQLMSPPCCAPDLLLPANLVTAAAADDPNLLRNRPIGDRTAVITAGVLANMVLAFAICVTQVRCALWSSCRAALDLVDIPAVHLRGQHAMPLLMLPPAGPRQSASRSPLLFQLSPSHPASLSSPICRPPQWAFLSPSTAPACGWERSRRPRWQQRRACGKVMCCCGSATWRWPPRPPRCRTLWPRSGALAQLRWVGCIVVGLQLVDGRLEVVSPLASWPYGLKAI